MCEDWGDVVMAKEGGGGGCWLITDIIHVGLDKELFYGSEYKPIYSNTNSDAT